MSVRLLGKYSYALALSLWLVASFIIGQSLASLIIFHLPINANETVVTTILAALGYVLALLFAIIGPALLNRRITPRSVLGIDRLPSWSDIGLGITALLPYFVLSAVILYLGMEVFTIIDPDVGQDIPFKNLNLRIEYLVAFVTLVIMAPLAEELLFRGYYLGKLGKKIGRWLAVFVSALLFGFMHLIAPTESGIVLQWGAAADTFALGVTVGILRALTKSIWAGVILHAIKNGIAYYFLFINPSPPTGM
ncbi:CPBP family intramembrane metalloprotease [Candidatus Saccharibacteria bacterium]|nr:CPBP family intramembrane metalloprotease [Candidatus Saccharibacteria bacterium]